MEFERIEIVGNDPRWRRGRPAIPVLTNTFAVRHAPTDDALLCNKSAKGSVEVGVAGTTPGAEAIRVEAAGGGVSGTPPPGDCIGCGAGGKTGGMALRSGADDHSRDPAGPQMDQHRLNARPRPPAGRARPAPQATPTHRLANLRATMAQRRLPPPRPVHPATLRGHPARKAQFEFRRRGPRPLAARINFSVVQKQGVRFGNVGKEKRPPSNRIRACTRDTCRAGSGYTNRLWHPFPSPPFRAKRAFEFQRWGTAAVARYVEF